MEGRSTFAHSSCIHNPSCITQHCSIYRNQKLPFRESVTQELHKGVRFSSESNKVFCGTSIVTTGGYVGEKIQET